MNARNPLVADSFITQLCDSDSQWGPLLFLRPGRDQRFTILRASLMALIPGLAFGALGAWILNFAALQLGAPEVPWYSFPITMVALYFSACSLMVAPAWNRRAARLVRVSRYHSRQ
jgi:hypothetical protein